MTEPEWLACTDPVLLLELLKGKTSKRKLRLFACGYGRCIWDYMIDERSRKAIEVAEQFADGSVNEQELLKARCDAEAAYARANIEQDEADLTATYLAELASGLGEEVLSAASSDAGTYFYDLPLDTQACLLRCIFNPFRPISLDRAWLTPKVKTLAQAIYHDRVFERMPELADVLAETGCTNHDILGHCRGPGAHVRGCWLVDLVLEKK
jgi:hypothetical protein